MAGYGPSARRRACCWLLGLGLAAGGGSARAQLPASGLKTDVAQTSGGEMQLTPLPHSAGLYITWAGRQVYINPQGRANFEGWVKADLVVVTTAKASPEMRAAIATLRKGSTRVIAPAGAAKQIPGAEAVLPGQSRSVELPGLGNPVKIQIDGVADASARGRAEGEGYVFDFGGKRVYFSGQTGCTPEIDQLSGIDFAFVAIDPAHAMGPKAAAACVSHFHPRVVYPYDAQGNGNEVFADALKPAEGIQVRVRSW